MLPVALPLSVAAIAVSLLGYVRWSRAVPGSLRRGRSAWLMPCLRAMALLVLVFALLKPTVLQPAEPGSVLILIDCSISMSAIDNARSIGQWVALADALDRLPVRSRVVAQEPFDRAIADVRQQFDNFEIAQREVEFNRQPGTEQLAAQAHLKNATTSLADSAHRLIELKQVFKLHEHPINGLLSELERATQQWPDRLREARGSERLADLLKRLSNAAADFQLSEDARLYATNVQVRDACDTIKNSDRLELARAALLAPSLGILKSLNDSPVIIYAVSDQARRVAVNAQINADGTGTDLPAALHEAMTDMKDKPLRAIVLLSDGHQTAATPLAASGLAGGNVPVMAIAMAPVAPPRDAAVLRIEAPPLVFASETVPITVQTRGHPAEVILYLNETTLSARPDANESVTFQVHCSDAGVQRVAAEVVPNGDDALAQNNQATVAIRITSQKINVVVSAPQGDARAAELNRLFATMPAVQLLDPTRAGHPQMSDIIFVNIGSDNGVTLRRGSDSQHADQKIVSLAGGEDSPSRRIWQGDDSPFHFAPASGSAPVQLASDPRLSRRLWDTLPPPKGYVRLRDLASDEHPLLLETETGDIAVAQRGSDLYMGLDLNWMQQTLTAGQQTSLWRQWLLAVSHIQAAAEVKPNDSVQSAELADIAGDRDYLARLAQSTGGDMIGIEQLSQFSERLRTAEARQPRLTPVGLWDSPYLFAFVAACLTVEWALRKGAGMA